MFDRIPATIATISAVSTEAMILFHSKDDINDPSDHAGSRENRIPPDSSNELSRFRRWHEPGMLSLLDRSREVVDNALPKNPIILIPARLAATRLPGKPLAEIAGAPMIIHVWRRAVAAEPWPVVVACGDREIADVVEAAGGRAVLTDPRLPTGSDRIHQAISRIDPGRCT